jgi:hypothetical protein
MDRILIRKSYIRFIIDTVKTHKKIKIERLYKLCQYDIDGPSGIPNQGICIKEDQAKDLVKGLIELGLLKIDEEKMISCPSSI